MKNSFNVVTAYLKNNRGIGKNNNLPWKHIKKDMNRFTNITTSTFDAVKTNSVIMGRKTWESLPNKFKPLPNRKNIVVSKTLTDIENVKVCSSLTKALNYSYSLPEVESTFVIGGSSIYTTALKRYDIDNLYVTEVDRQLDADTFFPDIPDWMNVIREDAEDDLIFKTYTNSITDPNSEENQYLKTMRRILDEGEVIKDRTGVGTLSVFDTNSLYLIDTVNPDETDPTKLKYRVPIMTTKTLYLKGIVWELIWFLQGNTDAKWLSDKKVHIWDGNTSKEYLEKKGLDYEEGQLGPGYGHQWVNWGGDWKTHTGGINQIKNIIDILRKDPTSRRAVLSAWNVADLDAMALPPCHILYTFKVTDHDKDVKRLNCKVTIRSNDMFLGHPFNIMSTCILTILLSRTLGMLPGKISIAITDAHIYLNHVKQVNKQLMRQPLKFPLLEINKDIVDYDCLKALTYDDFRLTEYYHHSALKAPMAV
jgi:dihydrofolate reductase / thymidylate synthase